MKVAVIRCRQTEDMCGGSGCFRAAATGTGAFEEVGPVEIIGFVSCGGCPGKKAVTRAKMMADRGAEAIVLSSCITKGTPIGFPCPFAEQIRAAIARKLGDGTAIFDFSHHAK